MLGILHSLVLDVGFDEKYQTENAKKEFTGTISNCSY